MKLRMTTVERAEFDAYMKTALVALNNAINVVHRAATGQVFPMGDHYVVTSLRRVRDHVSDIQGDRHEMLKVDNQSPNDADRLYRALALFDTRDGGDLASIVRAAREGYERSDPEMGEPGAWDEFDRLIQEHNVRVSSAFKH